MSFREVDSDNVTLNENESTTGTLSWDTSGQDAGTYTMRVRSDDDIEEFTIDLVAAIPDSTVLNARASDYDGSTFQSNIGPNIPDANGSPTLVSGDINGYDAVDYDGTDDSSQTTTSLSTTDPKAIIFTAAINTDNNGGVAIDSDSDLAFALNDDSSSDWNLFRGGTNGGGLSSGTFDSNYHVYAMVGRNGSDIELEIDGTLEGSTSASTADLTGLTIGDRGALGQNNFEDINLAEITVLDNFATGDKDEEIQRQADKFGITI